MPECRSAGDLYRCANLGVGWFASVGMAGAFVPHCSACRYDLTGLPDGVCPECGAAYTLHELMFLEPNPSVLAGLGCAAGTGIVALVLALPCMALSNGGQAPEGLLDFLTLYFGVVGLLMIHRERWSALVLALYFTFACLLPARLLLAPHNLLLCIVSMVAHAMLAVPVIKYQRELGVPLIFLLLASPMVALGVPMLRLDPAGPHWTDYLHPTRLRPDVLTAQEARVAGLMIVLLCGVAIAVLAWYCVRRRARAARRAAGATPIDSR